MRRSFAVVAGICVSLIAWGAVPSSTTAGRTILRVAIYEYIPGYEIDKLSKLHAEIERRFEEAHPDIDLVISATSDREKLYDLDTLKRWLTQSSDEFYHVLEVDTLLLGDLAASGSILPVTISNSSNLFAVGLEASRVDGKLFGIPHLLCGYFMFARDAALLKGEGQREFLGAVLTDNDDAVDLLGEFNGSWTLPSLYLDAWMDRNPKGNPADALKAAITQPDRATMDDIKKMISLCKVNGENPCFSGAYWNLVGPNALVSSFALGQANAFVGYSERLYHMKKILKDNYVGVRSAPLGDGDNPLLFSDAFVVGKNCVNSCKRAATAFAEFMNSDKMMEFYLLARDLGDKSPARYLLPATISAFSIVGVKQDKIYSSFEQHIRRATPYPNIGFVEYRRNINKKLKCEIDPKEC